MSVSPDVMVPFCLVNKMYKMAKRYVHFYSCKLCDNTFSVSRKQSMFIDEVEFLE